MNAPSDSAACAFFPFLATCPRGLEGLLAEELTALGAEVARESVASVHGSATMATLYRLCLWSRLANRIVRVLGRFDEIDSARQLSAAAATVGWEDELGEGATIRVDFHGRGDEIRHTRFGAQCVKDGVVQRLGEQGRARPTVDPGDADLRLYAHLHRGRLTLGVDLSGDSLHLRGYRLEGASAPLKENLAAALLIRAGWPERAAGGESLYDPLCGSGTLVIEAALIACDIAPNLSRRRFGFHAWARHDESLWRDIHGEAAHRARVGQRDCSLTLVGRDRDSRAIAAARANAARANAARANAARSPVEALVRFEQGDATAAPPVEMPRGLVMTNPPYGERLGELPALIALYQGLGATLREHLGGWSLALLTGDARLGHRLGMRAHRHYAFKNGSLDCRLLLIEVHPRSAPASDGPAVTAAATAAASHSEGARMFANRLAKNRKRLSKWLRRSGVSCYRLYDADMPEYALAIDLYADRVQVQEYAAPASIAADQAERRLMEALGVLPEVLGVTPEAIYLKRRQRQSGSAQYERRDRTGERFEVREGDARLLVNLRDYLDTGLFLDHRPVRRWLGEHAGGKSVLNLFCYTASATVQAALGGARESLSLDMSNTYLKWAEDNFRLNRLDLRRHRLLREDCMKWLEQDGAQFDLIFLDPPSFSNSKKMDSVLDVQRDHTTMIEAAMRHLAPGGELLFSNNLRRFRLDEALRARYAVTDLSRKMLDPDFERRPDIHHVFHIVSREGQ
ncbi:bifunctional 23S rRNA (guanine(2069)-N(7))-methyltransferase RlmK/23S rRNA (guanine(2445)-N(2))-methyltransferase RlmL [Kushneria aurantia]|uniref:Ribosomal RNA large subunit methyltransferase K/L n=1 Tax=Kushneria aurantia TaxID=504092 RepID=A0ABV6G4G9_9GAMM|nr:bifunctional 23S rRNA (guanine(2069)-N(7))-methyltransferase RlmK/23S rRNA (guanine(2445)-N(2))-methyltransferase RlmL [Kushneria aurantia]